MNERGYQKRKADRAAERPISSRTGESAPWWTRDMEFMSSLHNPPKVQPRVDKLSA